LISRCAAVTPLRGHLVDPESLRDATDTESVLERLTRKRVALVDGCFHGKLPAVKLGEPALALRSDVAW
jgi:hypothetical protein